MSVTPVPSDDDEDFDIYGDLPVVNIEKENLKQAVNEECQPLKERISQLLSDMNVLQKNNEKLKSDNYNLSCNISILLKTASAEVERKDKTICELRRELDNVVFRRRNKKLPAASDHQFSTQLLSQGNAKEFNTETRLKCGESELPVSRNLVSECEQKFTESSSQKVNESCNRSSEQSKESVVNRTGEECKLVDKKPHNTIKEVPKKRKILISYDLEPAPENSVGVSEKNFSSNNNERRESHKKSVWERLDPRFVPQHKLLNNSASPSKALESSEKCPNPIDDKVVVKPDHQTVATHSSEALSESKGYEQNPTSLVVKPSAEGSSPQEKTNPSSASIPCTSSSLNLSDPQISLVTVKSQDIPVKCKVTEYVGNLVNSVDASPPAVCESQSKDEVAAEILSQNAVNSLNLEGLSREIETADIAMPPPSRKDLFRPLPNSPELSKATSVVAVPVPDKRSKSSPLPGLKPTIRNEVPEQLAPFQPPLPRCDPAPLPPLPLTTPPTTPCKRGCEQLKAMSETKSELIQSSGNTAVIEPVCEQNTAEIVNRKEESPKPIDKTQPPRWSNENLLMQCPFRPRRRAKSVVLVLDATTDEVAKVSSETQKCTKSDVRAKITALQSACKSPDSKYKKTPLKKSDNYENRIASDFRSHQTQRSAYNSRHLSSVKSFAHMPERRSPSELLNGRSGRIERLTHEDKIRIRLRDRRSRSLSPQKRRTRQNEYRTRNRRNVAAFKNVERKIDDHESKNDLREEVKNRKSLCLRKKPSNQNAKEEHSVRHKSKIIADLFGESSPEPEGRTSKHGGSSKNVQESPRKKTLSLSQKCSVSPKAAQSSSRKTITSVTVADKREKECTLSGVSTSTAKSLVPNTYRENEKNSRAVSGTCISNDSNPTVKSNNLESPVIVVRRRARSTLILGNSEDSPLNTMRGGLKNVGNLAPLSTAGICKPKEPLKEKIAIKSIEDRSNKKKSKGVPKLSNTPLYFRERALKRSISEDSLQDEDYMEESDESTVRDDSDDTYNPKKAFLSATKRKPTKRRK